MAATEEMLSIYIEIVSGIIRHHSEAYSGNGRKRGSRSDSPKGHCIGRKPSGHHLYIPLRKGVLKALLNWVSSPLEKQIVAAVNQHQAEASIPREDTDAPHMHQP